MGVTINLRDEDEYCSMSYSGLQTMRQYLIISNVNFLVSEIEKLENEKKSKKRKVEVDEEIEEEDVNEELGEQLADYSKILDSLRKWCSQEVSEKKSITFDRTNFLYSILQMKSMMMPINYENVEPTYRTYEDIFAKYSFSGVYKFVQHSDCDGYHSIGDCMDILLAFERGIEHLGQSEDTKEWFEEVKGLFGLAVDEKKEVYYA